jgi:di/tricarboxylate transporter
MVLSGCVKIEHAYQAIDVRIFVMIAGVIPLGTAMEKTGIAQVVADQLLLVSAGWNELAMLALMFASASLLTQVLSDSATIVLIGPIAIAVATALGLPPVPFVVCTALGAVASFLTPIGHHGNLLVLGPGRYTFGDFLRMGLPLTFLLGGISCWLARALWLGGPWWPGR